MPIALVVDDSMLIRYTVSEFLERRGFAVESATNGAEALGVMARVRPDLIVTDMRMPTMSGGELITALKARPETAAVPIIIVAARVGLSETETRAADYVIYKDIDIDAQLGKALEAVTVKSRAARAGK